MSIVASILPYAQVALSIVLVVLILLQRSEAGLGGAFGGNDGFGTTVHTRRGLEKILFRGTVVVAVLFVVSAFLSLFVR